MKDSLGGNCNTLLLACIWGESQHLEETMSTLRLASRMMRVQNETHAVSGDKRYYCLRLSCFTCEKKLNGCPSCHVEQRYLFVKLQTERS